MQTNLFVQPKQLWLIPDFKKKSRTFIYREYAKMKDFFDKDKHQKITYSELAEYLGVNITDIMAFLR